MFVWVQKAALILAGVLTLSLVACSPTLAPELTFSQGWVRVPPGGRDITAGYVLITNQGGKDTLVSASSPSAEYIEMHENIEEDGMMEMRQVKQVRIPAKAQIAFEPGGYHLMMFGVENLIEGQEIDLILQFQKSGTRTVHAKVGLGPPSTE